MNRVDSEIPEHEHHAGGCGNTCLMLCESIIPTVGIGFLPISLRRFMTSLSKVDRNHPLSDHERKWLQTVRHLWKCGGSILHRHPAFIR